MQKQSFLEQLKNTCSLQLWCLFKVPLINLMTPWVRFLNDEICSLEIPLRFWTKNHFQTLYISAQVTGAELSAGLLASHHIRKTGQKVSILFKDFEAQFKKRPDANTVFTCNQGLEISQMVEKAVASGERQQQSVKVVARCPDKHGEEIVSEFQLTLSIKRKS